MPAKVGPRASWAMCAAKRLHRLLKHASKAQGRADRRRFVRSGGPERLELAAERGFLPSRAPETRCASTCFRRNLRGGALRADAVEFGRLKTQVRCAFPVREGMLEGLLKLPAGKIAPYCPPQCWRSVLMNRGGMISKDQWFTLTCLARVVCELSFLRHLRCDASLLGRVCPCLGLF